MNTLCDKDLGWGMWDVEFDTVIGRRGGKTLLTFVLITSGMFLARLMDKNTQQCVCDAFDDLERILKNNRERCVGEGGMWWFFSSTLTDRGSEMGDFKRLERSAFPLEDGCGQVIDRRCSVFYCDPYSPWQKPHIEQAHTLLRRVLPKGTSFDSLTQKDIDLICSHINSYTRRELGGVSPFVASPPGFSEKLIDALGQKIIDADDVNLTPRLLDR